MISRVCALLFYYICMTIKDYLAAPLVGNTYKFKCDCIFPLNTIGTVKAYSVSGNEIIFKVDIGDGKIIDIGENHPNLIIEPV